MDVSHKSVYSIDAEFFVTRLLSTLEGQVKIQFDCFSWRFIHSMTFPCIFTIQFGSAGGMTFGSPESFDICVANLFFCAFQDDSDPSFATVSFKETFRQVCWNVSWKCEGRMTSRDIHFDPF